MKAIIKRTVFLNKGSFLRVFILSLAFMLFFAFCLYLLINSPA
jgi:hypothetical protein